MIPKDCICLADVDSPIAVASKRTARENSIRNWRLSAYGCYCRASGKAAAGTGCRMSGIGGGARETKCYSGGSS